jgi:chromosome segregation ATPase
VKLGELMQFVEWLQPAMKAIEKRDRIPDAPKLAAGEVGNWVQTIRKLEERRRESEELYISLKSEMKDREAYVGRVTQQLQTSITEAKAAQAALQELQREVAMLKGMLSKVSELSGEIARYDGQMKSMASEILSKGSQLDKLALSFKEVAEALKSATKPGVPR